MVRLLTVTNDTTSVSTNDTKGLIMTKTYTTLPTLALSSNNTYSHPPYMPELIHLDDPATQILIDFETQQPAVVEPKQPINEVMVDMKALGIHLMPVVQDERIIGLISSEDILGEKPMQLMQDRRITREEVLVNMVMTPADQLLAIEYDEISHSRVGHVLSTLNEAKQHYALVVDVGQGSAHHTVHGLIYFYDIIKRLDKDVVTELRQARNLLELNRLLNE